MVSEQVNPENRGGVSVYASYSQRICRLARCKQPFQPVRIDQVFCQPKHRLEYHNQIIEMGKKVIAKKERSKRMKNVWAVTQNMTAKERLAALVETAQAVFSRHPLSPFRGSARQAKEDKCR